MLPTKAPVTLTTKLVGAGPLTGRSHDSETRFPVFVAVTFRGVPGMPVQDPGTTTTTPFEFGPSPARFTPCTHSSYRPGGTLLTVMLSVTGMGTHVLNAPRTTMWSSVEAPPLALFIHASETVLPSTSDNRFSTAAGTAETFTNNRTSFEATLRKAPESACTRM